MENNINSLIALYTVGKIAKEDVCSLLNISQRTFERELAKAGFTRNTHIRNGAGVYFEKNNFSFWKNLHNKYMGGDSLTELEDSISLNRMAIRDQFLSFGFEIKSEEQINEEKVVKAKKTCKEKYGKDHHFKTKEGIERLKTSVRLKYGVDNVQKLESVQAKKEQTLMENYGVKSPLQSKKIKRKQEQTMIERYGVDNAKKIKK